MSDFSPDTTNADAGTIRERAQDLYAFVGRILGRAGDVKAAFDSSAVEFSDLVADSISGEASYNRTAWQNASFLAVYAGGVTEAWSDDVAWYKTRTDTLETQWDEARENHYGIAVPSADVSDDDAWQTFDERRSDAKQELLISLEAQAESAREEFERRARGRAAQLSEGPTEESVRDLVRTDGVLAWAPNNLGWADAPLPVTAEDGGALAEELIPYLNGEQPLDARYAEILTTLGAVSDKGWRHQTYGTGELPSEEVAFLRAFYAGLDVTPVNHHAPPPFLDMVGRVATDDEYGPDGFLGSERNGRELLGALGDGLLVLSDEQLGGGWDDLPSSVRGVLSGQNTMEFDGEEHTFVPHWDQLAAPVVDLFGHTHPGIQGGTEFSANMIVTLGGATTPNAFSTPDSALLAEGGAGAQTLLDVATRNIEANHAVLTGSHESPHHIDSQTALRHLYGFDWSDDGDSLNGLTNWIRFEDSRTLEVQRELAAEAMAGLITTLTDSESGTFDDLAGERKIDGRQTNLGMLNPEIARHLVDLSEIYMESFAQPERGAGTVADGDTIDVNSVERVRFWMLAAGDPQAALDLTTAIEGYQAQRYADLVNGDEGASVVGGETATLRGMYDLAILNEAGARENYAAEDAATAQQEGRRTVPLLSGSAKEILNNVIVKDPRAKALIGISNEVIRFGRDWMWSGAPGEDFSVRAPTTEGPADIELGTLLSLADAAVANGELDTDDLQAYSESARLAEDFDRYAAEGDEDALAGLADDLTALEWELREELRDALGDDGIGILDEQLITDQIHEWQGIVVDPEEPNAQRFVDTILDGSLKRNQP